ncbi:MAG: hypothetical protein ABOJ95_001320 [Wolbachia endosymbiont of Armadillidium vulgare]|uniref:Uncharacterized protein n=1 Tax=Wolbachia endosymbiont of Armadillidium arcangelii TaxID=3158571 RepID=A0AAU7Q4D6_9RICK|nr:hypothetical protein [Wolbachia endosymbiont of Armadillidium vulgare]
MRQESRVGFCEGPGGKFSWSTLLEIVDGRIAGSCHGNSECDRCVEAVNNSIVDRELFFSAYNVSVPESTVYII